MGGEKTLIKYRWTYLQGFLLTRTIPHPDFFLLASSIVTQKLETFKVIKIPRFAARHERFFIHALK